MSDTASGPWGPDRTAAPLAALPAAPPAMSSVGPVRQVGRFLHHGSIGGVAPIFLKNVFFNIITLSFYRFWARTQLRYYFWANSEVFGDRFEYSGRGVELFVGFLFAALLVLSPIGFTFNLLSTVALADLAAQAKIILAFYVVLAFLYGLATFRARRYRLSRTRWRGIRLFQTGSALRYALMYMLFALLKLASLGWVTPIANTWLERYRLTNTHFGDRRFAFTGVAGDLYGAFAVGWVFAVLTFGLGYFHYKARELAYFARRTRCAGATFRFDPTAWRLLRFWWFNMALLAATLGLAYPFVQLRRARFVARHLAIVGAPNFEQIRRLPVDSPVIGEGLADAVDIDGI